MKIKSEIYEKLLHCPQVPPEVGGILGGKKYVIENVVIDTGRGSNLGIKYAPNIAYLNQQILLWSDLEIDFYGLFHTHSKRWPILSNDDKKYIDSIMKSMPNSVNTLYFPLVFPGDIIKAFRASKMSGKVNIVEDQVEIV